VTRWNIFPRLIGFAGLCIGIWSSKRPSFWKLLATAVLLGTTTWSLFWTTGTKLILVFPVAAVLATEVWQMPKIYRKNPVPPLIAMAVLLGLLPLFGIARQLFGGYPLPSPEREQGVLACAAFLLIGISAAVTLARVLCKRYFQERGQ